MSPRAYKSLSLLSLGQKASALLAIASFAIEPTLSQVFSQNKHNILHLYLNVLAYYKLFCSIFLAREIQSFYGVMSTGGCKDKRLYIHIKNMFQNMQMLHLTLYLTFSIKTSLNRTVHSTKFPILYQASLLRLAQLISASLLTLVFYLKTDSSVYTDLITQLARA